MKKFLFIVVVLLEIFLLSSNSFICSHAYAKQIPLSDLNLQDFMAKYSKIVGEFPNEKKQQASLEVNLTYRGISKDNGLDEYFFLTKDKAEVILNVNKDNLIESITVTTHKRGVDSSVYLRPIATAITTALEMSDYESNILSNKDNRFKWVDGYTASGDITESFRGIVYNNASKRYIHYTFAAAFTPPRYEEGNIFIQFSADDSR